MERYWGDSDPVAANVLAVPAIEECLAETAKELVDGEGWVIADSLEKGSSRASVWVLDVQRKGKDERTESLEHIGLHDYLAPCDECNEREEKFHRERSDDGMVKFVGEDCGRVVSTGQPEEDYSVANFSGRIRDASILESRWRYKLDGCFLGFWSTLFINFQILRNNAFGRFENFRDFH